MDEIIKQLYELAEGKTVNDDDLVVALGLEWDSDHELKADGVADLAALMEESSSQGYENDTEYPSARNGVAAARLLAFATP